MAVRAAAGCAVRRSACSSADWRTRVPEFVNVVGQLELFRDGRGKPAEEEVGDSPSSFRRPAGSPAERPSCRYRAPALTVRISSELLPIWRGPLMVSVCPAGWTTASAVSSVGRGRYHGSSTSSVPPGTGSGAAYGGGRCAADRAAALATPLAPSLPAIAASSSCSSCGVSCGPSRWRTGWRRGRHSAGREAVRRS